MTDAEATKVKLFTKTFFFGLRFKADKARCSAAVPEFTAQQYLLPIKLENSLSKKPTSSPRPIQFLSKTF